MSRATLDTARLPMPSRTRLSRCPAGLSRPVLLASSMLSAVRTPQCTHRGLGSSAFARRYLRNHFCFLFLRLLRCFSSPGSLPYTMDSCMDTLSGGFPHSDIRGSTLMCSSPRLFAAYHVFLRLSVPRHPPCAFLCLTFIRTGLTLLQCKTACSLHQFSFEF